MLTIKDILTDRITLDIECVDRVYLNGYVKHLQLPGGLITFIREQLGFPIPWPMVLAPVSDAFRKAVEAFAQAHGLTIVDFAKDEDKDETARTHLAQFPQSSGVVLIGKASAVDPRTSQRGNDYFTFRLADETGASLKVFSWGKPAMAPGDRVEVQGRFQKERRGGRYTFTNEVEAVRIRKLP